MAINQKHHFKVYKKPCVNCLFTADRIVSPNRAAEVIKDSIKSQTHFVCHKSSMGDDKNGDQVCCRKFYDEIGDTILSAVNKQFTHGFL